MTYFDDLSPYSYLPETVPDGVIALNVGWLDGEHGFETGDVPAGFLDELARICLDHAVARTRGWHACELHHADGGAEYPITVDVDGNSLRLGSAELRVISVSGEWLIAPNLVYHYIRDHAYLPPEVFIDAVLEARVV